MSCSIPISPPFATQLIFRLNTLLLLNREPDGWYIQRRYRAGEQNSWRPGRRPMADEDLVAMLRHHHWLACRAPVNGLTDRLAFDLDCKTPQAREHQLHLYRALRRVMGEEHVPLVWSTPSGLGLRVVYRIPLMPLEEVITGVSTGLIADVCDAAGVPVVRGQLEVFPQRLQVDRLPLGRDMPILDPDTLASLPHANLGAKFAGDALEGAIGELERWHARVYSGLVPHLRAQRSSWRSVQTSGIVAPMQESSVRHGDTTGVVSVELQHLVTAGLEGPGTRYWAEFRVGFVALLQPSLLGIAPPRTDLEVAQAIAGWLAVHHNNHSQEWRSSLRRLRSVGHAEQWWVDRYLQRNPHTGKHMIDRVEEVLGRSVPEMRRTTLVTATERHQLMEIAAAGYPPGAQRYRAEC